jgi:hypothetical protein
MYHIWARFAKTAHVGYDLIKRAFIIADQENKLPFPLLRFLFAANK